MSATWILKFPQVDKPKQPILVHVRQKHDASIDLDLIATDGEEAYKGKVRQRHIPKLKSPNFDGTDEVWTALLRYALVSKQTSDTYTEQTQNLDVDCTVSGKGNKAKLSITLRHKIEDITHKLGAIELSYSESTDDVDLFGWACQLADQRDDLEARATASKKDSESKQHRITTIENQMNDLVKSKEEHEEQLLSKFAVLLNEKKMKIRDQQRVLKTAKVDEKQLSKMQLSTVSLPKGKKSTKRKRGSDVLEAEDIVDEHDSDGFEPMDVDANSQEEQDGDNANMGDETPPRSSTPETVTASEDEGTAREAQPKRQARSKESEAKGQRLPPKEFLPFQKKGETLKRVAAESTAIPGEDEETESEDDEL